MMEFMFALDKMVAVPNMIVMENVLANNIGWK